MTISRQFYALVSVPLVLLIAFSISLTYRFADLSASGARLIEGLQHTASLNQALAHGNTDLSDQLQRQVQYVDPSFPDTFRQLNYRLGEQYTEYLKLDIDRNERFAVERIKSLQDELSILTIQVYEQLRAGGGATAAARLHRVYQIEGEIRDGFEKLNALQVERLRGVVTNLNRAAVTGFVAAAGLLAALLIALAVSIVMVKRRIQQPLRAILMASDRIREGDLTARAPAPARLDEIGLLTQRFNFMAQSLAEHQASLELKVEERSRQLEAVQGQLVRAEKMSAVGVLVSGVAHELNNPLAAIMGFVELARMELAGGGKGSCFEHLAELDSQVERCQRIVRNLLQFARQQEPHLEAVAINALVEQLLRLREYEFRTRNASVVREFDPSDPVVSADPDKLQQLVLNLLNNAHDAVVETGRPGTIWVRTRAEEGVLVLEVADNGPGFREPGRAFDPFYTTKTVGKGTGLGLSVCYGIVREHDGDITAKNWEQGALVTVTLPAGGAVKPRSPAQPTAPDAAAVGTGSRRALVVDDEELLLRLQASFLSRMGVEAEQASTGEEAIRYLEGHDVDVVVSDIRMPGAVDGIALYEWARATRPDVAQKFVFVSGDLVGLNLGEFFTRTAVPRIEKPFRFEEYRRVVGGILTSGGRRS